MCLLISEISFPAVDLLYVSAGKGENQPTDQTHICAFGALFGAVPSALLLLELNKIVQKLSLRVIIMEFP